MENKYASRIKTALKNYSKHAERPGYPNGFFTACRHSFRETEDITTFINAVKNKPATAKKMIEIRLANFPQNNHSFNAYLLDQLIENFPEERWETHLIKEKQIVFYKPTNDAPSIFRGTLQSPEDAFNNGMHAKKSKSIEDYAYDTSRGTGVSCTKNPRVAHGFSTSVYQTPRGCYYQIGHTYAIHLRKTRGVDIVETQIARGSWLNSTHQDEVNVIGHVAPEDIIGTIEYDIGTGTYKIKEKNPNYKKEISQEATNDYHYRLQHFSR